MHGVYMLMEGRIEPGLDEILLARELDPLNFNILTRLGFAYLCMYEFDKARGLFSEAHKLAKMDLYYQFLIAWSYLLQDQYARAEAELEKVEDARDGYQLKPGTTGFLHARQGRMEQARKKAIQIKELEKEGRIKFPHLNLTILYAGMNQTDEMFHHLEKAFQERPISLMFIQADPFWEKYRSDPRWPDLVRKAFRGERRS
jgi:tetratricopeptide (TPR) repeat protein